MIFLLLFDFYTSMSKYFNNSYLGIVSSLVREEQISLDELKELIAMVENEKQSSTDSNN